MSGETAAPEIGNALPLQNIPVGTVIHNIELRRDKALPWFARLVTSLS